MYYYSYTIYRGDTHYTDCFLSMCQIHSFFIYQFRNCFLFSSLFSYFCIYSQLSKSIQASFSVHFWVEKFVFEDATERMGVDAERKVEEMRKNHRSLLSQQQLFQWYHHHSGWLSVIHFYASSLLKLVKVASAHRITEEIRHTHTQAPASALTSLSNDVLVKRKPLGPPLCLFFSLQKPIKAKELRKLFMSIKNWQLSLMLLQNKAFLLLQRSPCWSQSHKKVPPFSPDFYGTNYVLSNLFCKW